MASFSIAVLLTCHNRRITTLECLNSLVKNEAGGNKYSTKIYLVDDSSTDNTADAVAEQFPSSVILKGDGTLFWCRGMCLAFSTAAKDCHDFYLWLNDDTLLYENALDTLIDTYSQLVKSKGQDLIVVGSIQDPITKQRTYGGLVHKFWWHPFRFKPLKPESSPIQCEAMNGNCVLVPHSVFDKIGNIDSTFNHYLGDFDYALRARRKGLGVWIAPEYVGTCSPNPSYTDKSTFKLSVEEQLEKLEKPKGLPTTDLTLYSFREWKAFSQRHGGVLWFIFFLLPYRRFVSMYVKAKFQDLRSRVRVV